MGALQAGSSLEAMEVGQLGKSMATAMPAVQSERCPS